MTGGSIVGAFVRRDWAISRSYRFSFISRIVSSVFSLFLFFYLGNFVDQSSFHSTDILTHGYFSFLIIGLFMLGLVNQVLEAFRLTVEKDLMAGTMEALLATPSRSSLLIIAGPTYDVLYGISLQVLVYIIAVLFFGAYVAPSVVGLIGAVFALGLCLIIFSSLGVATAGVALVLKRGGTFFSVYLMNILMVLGPVYYPVSNLPSPLQTFSHLLPFTWAVEALRAGLLRGDLLIGQLALLVLATMVVVPLSLWVFNLGLVRARRDGSLARF
jgi:ABC-2 type transport system permease protein